MSWRTALAILLAGVVGSAAVGQDDDKARDEEGKKKVEDFKAQLKKAKSDDEIEAALKFLGELQHPRCLKELIPYLKNPKDTLKVAAAKEVAKYKESKEAANALADALTPLVSNPKAEKDVIEALFNAFGEVGHKGTVDKIHPYIQHKITAIAKAAIQACAKVKSVKSVQPLIDMLKQLEAIQDPNKSAVGQGQPPGGVPGMPQLPGGGQVQQQQLQQDMWQRRQELTPEVRSALTGITGEAKALAKEWQDWWNKNGKSLKQKETQEEKKKEKK